MKRKIGLALATGLALLLAGCASQSTSGGSAAGGSASQPPAAVASTSRNFNLAVKCPGVHWEKTHGWSNEQIMQQESLDEDDIPACEQWVQAQPKGYVPPPPGGAVASKTPAPGAPPAPSPH
ncbi:MAG: hypothetical protein WCD12_16180 [Candidatus Binatus sp.]|jgi:hypothetical protein|uniref:hypothetical protein n=1 Tax=Candidatus Binatus sp. TaxID=2811406 RepID=UPI003C794990